MKRMQTGRWMPAAALLLAMIGAMEARADEFAIQSFDGTGRLTFDTIPTAVVYVVESAATPTGKWTTVQASRAPVNEFCMATAVLATCFYRLVAGVTNSYAPEPSGMVLIPGGSNSGTNPLAPNELYDEIKYPLTYSLTVDSFYMDATEVTKALWDEVRAWAATNDYTDLPTGGGKAANHPVQTVSWYDCVKWCNARSQKAGLTPVYYTDAGMTQVYKTGQVKEPNVKTSANGYRLPTNSEWEYAARGGVANHRFPWSDSDEIQHARANYYSSSSCSYDTSPTRGCHPTYATGGFTYTSPAGSFAANCYGLYDMAGNVYEWCYDWSPGYVRSYRVLRGGGWFYNADYCRVGDRDGGKPDYANDGIGCRAVLPPGQP